MGKEIYGVDLSKRITPIMVREAIIRCFTEAHKEVLDAMDESAEWKSRQKREDFRKMEIRLIIESAFRKAGKDYDKPTKADLIKVIDNLALFASKFREHGVIKKHYGEIKKLIDRLE